MKDHARAAYEVFAASYDHWTAGHDQKSWTGLVLRLAETAGLRGRRLLDVGCGTGSAIPPMIERGFSVVGTDISPAMITLAREKLGTSARLSVADMRALPALGKADLVWSLCDVVNYLLDEQELVDAFRGYRRNLAPGGIVAFDVDTLATLRKLYSSLLVVQDNAGLVVFDGRSPADLPSGGVVEGWIDRLAPAARPPWWTRERSVHRQAHHPEPVIRRALVAAGLQCVGVWGADQDGQCEQPFDDSRHNKAVYVGRAAP